jgi:hypothetical protein
MLVKVASYGNAGYIERKKLAIILKEPNNDFKWTDIMSDLDTFEMKIRHILAIYGITEYLNIIIHITYHFIYFFTYKI